DMWTFTANKGDSFQLRLGTTNFLGKLQLYGRTEELRVGKEAKTGDPISYKNNNSGTFTVLVSAYSQPDTGTYVLHLAQFPEAFVVPAGDEGGPMTNGGNYA